MAEKHKSQQIPGRVIPSSQQASTNIQINTANLVQLIDLNSAKPIIEAIQAKRGGTKLIALVYNDAPPFPAMLHPAAILPLSNILSKLGRVPKLDLFLRCNGGVAEVPWRVVSLLREFSDELSVIVPSTALSGATHIAISADELVMGPFSVLGSVDPSRNHPLLPKDASGNQIPISVEDLKHCISFVQQQLGASYPQQNLALIISELFKYINPLALGALEQSYNLSKLITRKCLRTHKKPLTDEQINKIEAQLASGYYSHSFLISRSEVESDLGLPVTKPDDELLQMILNLENYYVQSFNSIKPLPAPATNLNARVGGVIQSAFNTQALAQIVQSDGKLIGDTWLPIN
jgi:hypothetical protein